MKNSAVWLTALIVAALAWWWLRKPGRAPLVSGEAMRPMRPIGYSCASRGPASDACCAEALAAGEDLVDRGCAGYCKKTGLCVAIEDEQ